MNIFALSEDPQKAAAYHCDKHVNKMLLEGTQICNTSLHSRNIGEYAFYQPTHKNHPCNEWATNSWGNFTWLLKLIHYLNKEFMKRYNHDTPHKSYQKICDNWFEDGVSILPIVDEPRTQFVQCMPEDVQRINPITAYRTYYKTYKSNEDWFSFEKASHYPDWL